MKHVGIKVFVIVLLVLGLPNLLDSVFSKKSSYAGSGRTGYSYYSGSGNSYNSGSGYSRSSTPKATSAPPKATSAAPKATAAPTEKPAAKSRSKKNASSKDPYDAASYAHPEDFYYDHYHDFWDYEEAEEYWEDHQ